VGEDRTGEPQANQERLTVAQAAAALGITEGAVRSRIKRGTLPTTKERGTVFVLLGDGTSEANQPPNIGVPGDQSELLASLQDQVRYLREQLDAEREARTEERRRHDTVVAQLTSKIPAIEAPQEASEAAETVEETSDRAEPHSATGGAQEGTERPQQRSGWLAPVDKLPWWQYMLGLSLVFSGGFLTYTLTFGISSDAPVLVWLPKVVAAAWAPPGIFGFWVGYRKSNLRLWSQVLPLAALVGAVAWLGLSSARHSTFLYAHLFSAFNLIPLALVFFPAWLLFVSASLVGNTWQRRRIGRISGTTPASPVSRSTQGAAQQPRKDLTPAQQAMLGWGGTIISALITLVGTIIAVRSGG
jgi:hypothetical protein